MPEMGLVGTLLFVSICWQIVRRMRRVIGTRSDDPLVAPKLAEMILVAKAIIAALGAYLVSGAFITVIYYPHLFYLLGFAVAVSIAAQKLVPARSGRSAAQSKAMAV